MNRDAGEHDIEFQAERILGQYIIIIMNKENNEIEKLLEEDGMNEMK